MTVEILPEGSLEGLLAKHCPLRVKAGFDPTTPDLHLGHTVLLKKLRELQDLGHQVWLLIGDFTAIIGDPTGKNKTRPQLTVEQTLTNAETYANQVFKVLDRDQTQVVFNSSWLNGLNLMDVIKLSSKQTVARMLEREDFNLRYCANKPIGVHEFLYPLIQAYDSVALNSDLELGGTDQRFNLLMGREIQKHYNQSPQSIMLLPLLTGTDGVKKMSKSHGNTIDLTATPEDMFGQLMSISDELMFEYINLLSSYNIKNHDNPRDTKIELALELVGRFHNCDLAARAYEVFVNRFSNRQLPEDLPVIKITIEDCDILLVRLLKLLNLVNSSSEAIRLIRQGGVKIDKQKVTDPTLRMNKGCTNIYQVGKRRFARGYLK